MYKNIHIRDYGKDYGMGRVAVTYDNGLPDDPVVKHSFDTMPDALAWISRIISGCSTVPHHRQQY